MQFLTFFKNKRGKGGKRHPHNPHISNRKPLFAKKIVNSIYFIFDIYNNNAREWDD